MLTIQGKENRKQKKFQLWFPTIKNADGLAKLMIPRVLINIL